MPPLQIGMIGDYLVQTGPKLGPEGGRPLEYHLERMGLLMVSDHSCSYTVYQRNNSLKTTPGGLLFSPHYGPSLRWYMSWLPNISSCHLFRTRQHHHTVIGVYGTHANTYIYIQFRSYGLGVQFGNKSQGTFSFLSAWHLEDLRPTGR